MQATITYRVECIPHPWPTDKNRGIDAWCLVKIVTPEMGPSQTEAVAIFNFDSEAELFQAHILASDLDGKLVTIDKDVRELYLERKTRQR